MTEQQLLSIPFTTWISDEGKQELSRVAGEVLQPELPCWHDPLVRSTGPDTYEDRCSKCDQKANVGSGKLYDKSCQIPDPIPLTWQEAMKWRDWAVEKFGMNPFEEALVGVKVKHCPDGQVYDRFTEWICCHAQPEHYILAAVLCECRSWPIVWHDSMPCNHVGCLSHISHPCEECGRTAGRGEIRSKK